MKQIGKKNLKNLSFKPMTISRNDKCICNSGLKAKNCCLKTCCIECIDNKKIKKSENWSLKNSLIRVNHKFHHPLCPLIKEKYPKTLVIVGNGAVYWKDPNNPDVETNVWSLVQKASDSIKEGIGKGVGVPRIALNLLQWLSAQEELTINYFLKHLPTHPDFLRAKEHFVEYRKILGKFLSEADIRLRQIGCFHCKEPHFISPHSLLNVGFITLNWDGSIHNLPNTIEFHGSARNPETMILPNQFFTKLLINKGEGIKQGHEAFSLAKDWISECENVIIWGAQMNDYDAILCGIISIFSLNTKKGKINIFVSNSNKETREKISVKLKDFCEAATVHDCISKLKL